MVHSISATGRTVDGVQVADAVWRVDNRGLAPATDVELQIRIGSDAWVRVDGVPTPVIQPGESVEFAMAIPLANAGPPEAGIPSPLVMTGPLAMFESGGVRLRTCDVSDQAPVRLGSPQRRS